MEKLKNNELKIEVGKYSEGNLIVDLNKENGLVIAGFTGSGKTNYLDYVKSQLCINDNLKINVFNDKSRQFDSVLSNFLGEERFIQYIKNTKVRTEIKKYVKEVEKRLNKISKKNCDYETYIEDYMTEKENWKTNIIIIDDFSIGLMDMKLRSISEYEEYINNLVYLVEEGSKVGFKLIIAGYRCVNGDLPERLVDKISSKCVFKNPKVDYIKWDLLKDGLKYPSRIGECLIITSELEQPLFVKTYNLRAHIENKNTILINEEVLRNLQI